MKSSSIIRAMVETWKARANSESTGSVISCTSLAQFDDRRVAGEVGERAEQGEARHAPRMFCRKQSCNRSAHGVAGDDGAVDMHRVEEGERVGDKVVEAVVRARLARLAVATLAERQRAHALRQMRQQRQERVPTVGQAVQQQQRLAAKRAGLDVFDRHAGWQGGVLDLRGHPLLPEY
jgi:hypothetical protein